MAQRAQGGLKGLRQHTALFRNRAMAWDRQLDRPSAECHIGCSLRLHETDSGLLLHITDEDGLSAHSELALALEPARDAVRATQALRDGLAKLGGSDCRATEVELALAQPWFVPTALLNGLRRATARALP